MSYYVIALLLVMCYLYVGHRMAADAKDYKWLIYIFWGPALLIGWGAMKANTVFYQGKEVTT